MQNKKQLTYNFAFYHVWRGQVLEKNVLLIGILIEVKRKSLLNLSAAGKTVR